MAKTIPTGRSAYKPGQGRVGEASPQSSPDSFSTEDLRAEVKYLIGLNRRLGSNPLRTVAYMRLLTIIDTRRKDTT